MGESGNITALSIGHVTHDRVDGRIVPGGCAYYAASAFHALGADSRLVSTVGEDFCCGPVMDRFDWCARRAGQTTVFTNLYPEAGPRVQYVDQVAGRVGPDGLPTGWERPDVAFLGPVFDEVDVQIWKQALSARILAIGVQGYVRGASEDTHPGHVGQRVVPRPWRPSAELLRGVQVACLSEEDLEGQGDLLDHLTACIPLVALTRERKGCELIEANQRTWVGIHPAEVVDPTGAGDTFAAGLLYGLASGLGSVDAARIGAAAASIVIEGEAGTNFERLPEAFDRARLIP